MESACFIFVQLRNFEWPERIWFHYWGAKLDHTKRQLREREREKIYIYIEDKIGGKNGRPLPYCTGYKLLFLFSLYPPMRKTLDMNRQIASESWELRGRRWKEIEIKIKEVEEEDEEWRPLSMICNKFEGLKHGARWWIDPLLIIAPLPLIFVSSSLTLLLSLSLS